MTTLLKIRETRAVTSRPDFGEGIGKMAAKVFTYRYKESSTSPGAWREELISISEWAREDCLPEDEIHPESPKRWLSVKIWLRYDVTSEEEARFRARDRARALFFLQNPGAIRRYPISGIKGGGVRGERGHSELSAKILNVPIFPFSSAIILNVPIFREGRG